VLDCETLSSLHVLSLPKKYDSDVPLDLSNHLDFHLMPTDGLDTIPERLADLRDELVAGCHDQELLHLASLAQSLSHEGL